MDLLVMTKAQTARGFSRRRFDSRGRLRTGLASGVTLIEVLVVIAIVGVLMGLLVVALGRSRQVAGATKSVANLKGLGVTLSFYAEAHRGRNPFIKEGEAVDSAPPDEPEGFRVSFSPVWWLDTLWPTLMHDVAPWREHFESWISPGSSRTPPYWPIAIGHSATRPPAVSYEYSNSFLGRPGIWRDSSSATESDIGPTLVANVSHPSQKVILFDAERAYLHGEVHALTTRPLLMVDGSASLRLDQDAANPVPNPLNDRSPRLYHDTPAGIAGRDF